MVRRYEFSSPCPTLVIILSPIVPLPDSAVEDGGAVAEDLFLEGAGVDLITDPDRHHPHDAGHLVVVEVEDILHHQGEALQKGILCHPEGPLLKTNLVTDHHDVKEVLLIPRTLR
eukprot:TRINITY_DN8520_c0_g1_i2.p3 TRINITY_DN8520_c0_g1~~TRINITY_DN8520_c0_g1_i2.p3  ORF type:complete len:115 (+),score=7.91 TRINITY_DN8520_c0_g1_i2:473-817(+)